MGHHVVAEIARRDSEWFSWVAILLGVVLMVGLPLMFFMGVSNKKMMVITLDMQADVQRQSKEIEKLKRELKKGITHDTREEATDEK